MSVGGGRRAVWPRLVGMTLAVVALLVAAACGGSDDDTSKDQSTPAAPQAVATPGSAATQAAASTPAATTAAQSRRFTDDTGKSFTVEQPPKRVVALSPSVVEVMYAVNAPPVARVSSANFPEAARGLPAVGTSYQPNFEQIAAQNPDFIIADTQIQSPQTLAELAKLGAPVFAIRVQSVDDITKSLRTVGSLMGKTEDGEKAAKELEGKLQAAQAKLPPESERPAVFILVGTPDAFFAAKPDSFAGDVVKRLGAKNVVTEGSDTAQFPGFTSYSLERLVALDPDVILVISVGGPNTPQTSRLFASNPAWSGLRAVKAGRVQEMPADVLVQSAGPRVGQVIETLTPVLYPGR